MEICACEWRPVGKGLIPSVQCFKKNGLHEGHSACSDPIQAMSHPHGSCFCVYACVHVCTCVCTCLCIWIPEVKLWSHPSDDLYLGFFEIMVSCWPRTGRFGCLAKPRYLSITVSLPRDNKCTCSVLSLFWGLNSDPCVCVANILLTQPSHHPSELISRLSRDKK